MTLAERLREHVDKMQSGEPLDLTDWIEDAVDLLREAADNLEPKPWPPPDGWDECLAQDSSGDWHFACLYGFSGPMWFYETGGARGEPCEGDARRYLPAPEPEPEGSGK